ncbi:hypothetical protein MTO96_047331 [Rhipicephalus appendiculatus]
MWPRTGFHRSHGWYTCLNPPTQPELFPWLERSSKQCSGFPCPSQWHNRIPVPAVPKLEPSPYPRVRIYRGMDLTRNAAQNHMAAHYLRIIP